MKAGLAQPSKWGYKADFKGTLTYEQQTPAPAYGHERRRDPSARHWAQHTLSSPSASSSTHRAPMLSCPQPVPHSPCRHTVTWRRIEGAGPSSSFVPTAASASRGTGGSTSRCVPDQGGGTPWRHPRHHELTHPAASQGFGDASGEYWLGNEAVHLLTSRVPYALRIELQDWEGGQVYAHYGKFQLGSERQFYR